MELASKSTDFLIPIKWVEGNKKKTKTKNPLSIHLLLLCMYYSFLYYSLIVKIPEKAVLLPFSIYLFSDLQTIHQT